MPFPLSKIYPQEPIRTKNRKHVVVVDDDVVVVVVVVVVVGIAFSADLFC
jgi:hypothetical protein